jgi:hypothetical protein
VRSLLHAVEQFLGRQAEMQTDNFGLELLNHRTRFGIERFTGGRGRWSFRIQSELEVIGRGLDPAEPVTSAASLSSAQPSVPAGRWGKTRYLSSAVLSQTFTAT